MKQLLSVALMVLVSMIVIIGVSYGACDPSKLYTPGDKLDCILEEITAIKNANNSMPPWNQTLPASTRFIVLSNMGNAAVLDRETGLVWEKSPGDVNKDGVVDSKDAVIWSSAQLHCNNLTVGNRRGWRLPTLQELMSLLDPSVAPPGPTLPSGHPFSNVQSFFYWSATADASSINTAWDVFFTDGFSEPTSMSAKDYVWCVRGGQGVDTQ